jgi:hypothetical protein
MPVGCETSISKANNLKVTIGAPKGHYRRIPARDSI